MRGLKLLAPIEPKIPEVASFTDAWIETLDSLTLIWYISRRIFYRCVDWNREHLDGLSARYQSHLLQMRGLKQIYQSQINGDFGSHLLQMRGLKLNRDSCFQIHNLVASFTDAWIETIVNMSVALILSSRIFYRCVDWNISSQTNKRSNTLVASFTDAWIETTILIPALMSLLVASFTDAWIETYQSRGP